MENTKNKQKSNEAFLVIFKHFQLVKLNWESTVLDYL